MQLCLPACYSTVLLLPMSWKVAGGQQSLLVTVRVESLKHSSELDDSCSTESRANSGSSTCASNGNRSSIISSSGGSSVNARGLSGAARVAVLRGIARAAGVGSLSVGLGQIQLAPPAADMGQLGTGTRAAGTGLGPCPEGGKGSVHYLTFKVGGTLGWIEVQHQQCLITPASCRSICL